MIKALAYIAIFAAVFMAAYGGPGGQRPGGQGGQRPGGSGEQRPGGSGGQRPGGQGGQRPGGPDGDRFGDQLISKMCANQTVAQAFLTKMQELISTLQANGSFTQVLADRAQEFAYIQSSTSAASLASNCTAYLSGLKSAIDADRAIIETREQYFRAAVEATKQIIRDLIGGGRY